MESGPGAITSLPNYSKGTETPAVHYLFCHLVNMDDPQSASLETMAVSPLKRTEVTTMWSVFNHDL